MRAKRFVIIFFIIIILVASVNMNNELRVCAVLMEEEKKKKSWASALDFFFHTSGILFEVDTTDRQTRLACSQACLFFHEKKWPYVSQMIQFKVYGIPSLKRVLLDARDEFTYQSYPHSCQVQYSCLTRRSIETCLYFNVLMTD